ncbi:hypothetical protein H8356DRAFT_1357857 [Neocallimastix lanati (nom. inval.)]|nr:hypothetical protein H8356DRAFT_1357857 [Neocallimastix sp. JGI-2020a]
MCSNTKRTLRISKLNTRISKHKILILEHLIPLLIRKVGAEILHEEKYFQVKIHTYLYFFRKTVFMILKNYRIVENSSIHGHSSSHYAKISYSEILGFVTWSSSRIRMPDES